MESDSNTLSYMTAGSFVPASPLRRPINPYNFVNIHSKLKRFDGNERFHRFIKSFGFIPCFVDGFYVFSLFVKHIGEVISFCRLCVDDILLVPSSELKKGISRFK